SGYQPVPPFDASMMVHFRQRIGPELIKFCHAMTKANGIAIARLAGHCPRIVPLGEIQAAAAGGWSGRP
ncbi:hypothetical protein NZK33_19760, partial [Cyanobium sp. FGCU-6]|nr:hypothetical protein [Cyanobium sp. FGCU6]